MISVPDRLSALRRLMRERGIDMYIVFSEDFHGSEYVGEHFRCRTFISGFTGSAGTVVIAQDSAGLWTDGRYFLQAADQLKGSGIELFKMGNEGVPTVREYVKQNLPEHGCLGFDGRTISAADGRDYASLCAKKGGRLETKYDLIGEIWEERPDLSAEPAWLLDLQYAGESRENRIAWLRGVMEKKGADRMIITSLDDICWLLNLRGNDVLDNPVILSYLMLTKKDICLYVNESIFKEEDRQELENAGISFASYDAIYEDVKQISAGETVMYDADQVNYEIAGRIPEGARQLALTDPIVLRKAVKNPVEIRNLREAHLKDGAALTRFMYWLKCNAGKVPMTEIGLAKKMESFRKMQKGYIEPSFEPISGYGPHGAIVHYSATPETNAVVEPQGLLLMDTGGQYYEGTTDITRTFVMGPVTQEEKFWFTQVLRGHLNLAGARFLHGCGGYNLDILARQPLWENAADYNHGTGHGVGYLLNVHEAPNAFRFRIGGRGFDFKSAILQEGMVTSDEPGIYLEGKFGIRHESLTLCVKDVKNEFGQFMKFEVLTMVPIDLDGVEPSLMTEREKQLLNEYHRRVYENIAPRIPEEEREWLRYATRAI